jgi:hypothetical protein
MIPILFKPGPSPQTHRENPKQLKAFIFPVLIGTSSISVHHRFTVSALRRSAAPGPQHGAEKNHAWHAPSDKFMTYNDIR